MTRLSGARLTPLPRSAPKRALRPAVLSLAVVLGAGGACAKPAGSPQKGERNVAGKGERTVPEKEEPGVPEKGERPVQGKTIEAVLSEHADRLMSLPGVVGIAIGECAGTPCIKVLVAKRTPAVAREIPARLEGYPVSIEETGEFRAMDSG